MGNYLDIKVDGKNTVKFNAIDVTVTDVRDSDLPGLNVYIDPNGHINMNWYTTGSESGDIIIAYIDFEAAQGANIGDSCPLSITSSLFDSNNDPISHAKIPGIATIISCDGETPVQCDFDGNRILDIRDVRYLALYMVHDPAYSDLKGCNPDVNCDTIENSVDVRYLAKHLNGDPDYSELYPHGCSPFT